MTQRAKTYEMKLRLILSAATEETATTEAIRDCISHWPKASRDWYLAIAQKVIIARFNERNSVPA